MKQKSKDRETQVPSWDGQQENYWRGVGHGLKSVLFKEPHT